MIFIGFLNCLKYDTDVTNNNIFVSVQLSQKLINGYENILSTDTLVNDVQPSMWTIAGNQQSQYSYKPVGIMTTDPQASLHINGDMKAESVTIETNLTVENEITTIKISLA